jgi:hypothetical protein
VRMQHTQPRQPHLRVVSSTRHAVNCRFRSSSGRQDRSASRALRWSSTHSTHGSAACLVFVIRAAALKQAAVIRRNGRKSAHLGLSDSRR